MSFIAFSRRTHQYKQLSPLQTHPFKPMHSGEKSLFLDKILIEKVQIMEIFL
jgi:hypothetical protein